MEAIIGGLGGFLIAALLLLKLVRKISADKA